MNTVTLHDDATKRWQLIEADALAVLAKLPENSLDAIVTDPPYGIALGGARWDRFDGDSSPGKAFERWSARWAREALRILKPGGHLVAFGAPRTFHRLVSGIEDTGLDVRDVVMWLNHQGLPKSHRLPGGKGTGLRPAFEPILLARKPFAGRTIENIERHGTGALNIDATRIGDGRYWPANVTHTNALGENEWASRFFSCAKATRTEREAGCEQLPARAVALYTGKRHSPRLVRNTHPTVKPLALMRWLVRLVTPPGGVVLDPFTGSGSTGIAAMLEGRPFVGIERESEYADVACARLTHWARQAAKEPA